MKYTEEIFNILSKGGFISSNSVSPAVKRYYDAIEEELAEYYEYYKGIGFYLEGGDGYYLFTQAGSEGGLERKLEAAMKWIDYLSFRKRMMPRSVPVSSPSGRHRGANQLPDGVERESRQTIL